MSEVEKLKAENEKLKKENEELKKEIERLKGGKPSQPEHKAPVAGKEGLKPTTTKLNTVTDNPWETPVYVDPNKKVDNSVKKDAIYNIGSSNLQGMSFEQKLDYLVERKKNVKQTVEDINKRFQALKVKIDAINNKFCKGNPSQEDKNEAKKYMGEVLVLYQESRNLEHYDDIIKQDVAEKNIKFEGAEKEKFDDKMAILAKTLPFQTAQAYQKMNNSFRDCINVLFLDKNLRFYKPAEIKEVVELKDKIMFSKV